MTDNIFEIEATALAHVAFASKESSILLTDFVAAYPEVNHSWIFSVLVNTELPGFLCRLLRSIHKGVERRQILMARRYDKVVLRVVFSLRWPLTRSSERTKN